MSNILEFPRREQIYEQASLWIARLDRGLNDTEEAELRAWLARGALHREVLLELARLWDQMDSLARLADLFQEPPARPALFSRKKISAVAASLFIAIALIAGGQLQPQNVWRWAQQDAAHLQAQAIYQTPVGRQASYTLPDGSLLRLNTDSLVRVEFNESARLLWLERGEMNIEVAHDKTRPLSVTAAGQLVQAVGTAFNLRLQNNAQVALLVTDGKVRVVEEQAAPVDAEHTPLRLPTSALAVAQGEKILLGTRNARTAKLAQQDIAAELSWREGNLVFRGETLEQALAEISRYTHVRFEIRDDHIRNKRIAGLFRAGDIDGLLAALNQNFNIDYEKNGAEKIILRASRE